MSKDSFERDLIKAAFDLAAQQGWRRVSVAAAARHGGLELAKARRHFSCTGMILAKFGRAADVHALHGAMTDGLVRDRLFDIIMRRFDYLQQHREGVIALIRFAPTDPLLALWLQRTNLASMGWILEGAGVSSRGLRGALRKRGLLAVCAWALRAWMRDDSEDLSATMAALDVALMRADQAANQFSPGAASTPDPTVEPDAPFALDDPARPN
ncbi:TetR family transcriptional regulator [Acidiphilium sp. PA]|uniref:TetR family transcriptional regulator n=1 Tax=Acidiphilium sp. PA TaxID=2871705 RepID=UPI0022446665|nr:TetR family transcriptional regulator [Acidiphilium sp. PA]MCW8307370.1 TetR family transcriptional regulator [Acidiphilium sp. PA]